MRLRRIMAVLVVAALFGVAGAAQEEGGEPVADWNQERVTGYAKELSEACRELKTAMAQLPTSLDPAKQRSWHRAKDDVRMLNSASRGLAASLEKGEGKEETLPRFKRIEVLRNDAAENGRKALIPNSVLEKVTPVGVALMKLAPYYR